jgi:hypothetical protein
MSRHTNWIKIPLASAFAAAVLGVGCGEAHRDTNPAPAAPDAAALGADFTYESLLALLVNPDAFARARTLSEVLPKLGPEGIPIVKQVLDETSTAKIEIGNADYELLVRYWALHAPGDAASYVYGHAPRGYQAGAQLAAVQEWMKADPERGLSTVVLWAREEGDVGAATQVGLVRGWYDSGKPGLETYIHDLGPSFERQRALSVYATSVIRAHGVDEVVRWAEAVPDADTTYKVEVFRSVGDAMVPFDIEAAQRFCAAHCDGPNGSKLRNRIATRWETLGDSPAALEWLSKGEQDKDTQFAVRRTYAVWGSAHRQSAVSWMKDKLDDAGDPPEWLRPALQLYVEFVGRDAPAEGIALATHFFEGKEDREFEIIKIARHWRQQDEKAAEAFLVKSSLDAAALEKIRAPQTEYEGLMLQQEARQKAIEDSLVHH